MDEVEDMERKGLENEDWENREKWKPWLGKGRQRQRIDRNPLNI